MEEIFVSDVRQYLDAVDNQFAWLFRGVPKKSFGLIPSSLSERQAFSRTREHIECKIAEDRCKSGKNRPVSRVKLLQQARENDHLRCP